MSPTAAETYGTRIEKYQRREQMAIWIAAGIAALVAFVSAHALDGAPRVFTQLIFTCVVLAGVTVAFARVGFEWEATLLKRKTAVEATLKDAPLAGGDQPWPPFPEFCWTVCLYVITLAWIIMMIGIWWPRPRLPAPPVPSRAELQTFPIGSVGPFADCSADLPTASEIQLDVIVQNYRDHLNSNTRAALIILEGAADNRRLAPPCAAFFGTNEQLALARARRIRAQLEQKLSRALVQPSYAVLTSGPKHLEAKGENEGRQQDRAVDAWISIDPRQDGAMQKP
jgi:hypothetical protein